MYPAASRLHVMYDPHAASSSNQVVTLGYGWRSGPRIETATGLEVEMTYKVASVLM
jgi:hypothetical protein